LVEQLGVECALNRLCESGVYVTSDELKGRSPLKRGNLEIPVQASDFQNPFHSGPAFALQSSGSTGNRSRILVGFPFARDEALCHAVFLAAHGLSGRPSADLGVPWWIPLYYAKLGRPMEKFFTATEISGWRDDAFRGQVQAKLTVLLTQMRQGRLLAPQFSRGHQIGQAAEWLARKKEAGSPGLLITFSSPAVRVCLNAEERGLDISGSTMRVGGEPLTPAKSRVLTDAGVRPTAMYVSVETGTLAVSCAKPTDIDDLHFFTDRVGIVLSEKRTPGGGTINTLLYTSLSASSPRLLLNADSGDYATMQVRECGCLLGELGLTTHLSGIRSYEKLTSEGVTFLGSALHVLLEETLPRRFGGNGIDYQVVEEEEGSVTRVSILVSPRVGPVDEAAVVETVLEAVSLSDGPGRSWTGMWARRQTLRVIRRDPYQTPNAKVLPLHFLRPPASDSGS
jgi:hypothetical protein